MNFYYLDKKITSKSLKQIINDDFFSSIRIGKQSLEERFSEMLGTKIQKIFHIDEIESSDYQEFILCTSNIIFKDPKVTKIFFNMLKSSAIEYVSEFKNGFIFKGTKKTLLKYINKVGEVDVYENKYIFEIENIFDLKSIISANFHSRYFNSILKKDDKIIKKSKQKTKLEAEFLFLKSIPKNLKPFYAEVYEGIDHGNLYEYSVQAYDMFDVAYQHINRSIDVHDMSGLFNVLNSYFVQAMSTKIESFGTETSEIIEKNTTRFHDLENYRIFKSLNSFLENHKGISILSHHSRVESKLKENEKLINSKGRVLSHGDLCFSNILFSPTEMEIKLIDPRGIDKSNGYRSPYYDMAKLSHSLLGDYDFIVNGMTNINFDYDMRCSNELTVNKNHNYHEIFKSFLDDFKLDLHVVRLIESSLFLSMLPLHIEDTKKVFSLALRSVEIYEDLYG
jgi:hypothetical protein